MPAPAEVAEAGAPFTWDRPLGALIGSGGFASVWDAGDTVLKVAHADHELARARMAREAEALAAIGAPAVPKLHGHGTLPGGRAWIEMEKLAGASLSAATYKGSIGADRAVTLVVSALDALARVHAAGFIHRDLKPDNLMIRPDRSVVILDLGLARRTPEDPDDPTRANVQVGSLEYMPPEQLRDAASVDVRSDLYAIGCILFELCAGRPPFVGDAAALERAHAALRPPRLGAMAAVPAALPEICADCLAKNPALRPRSVADLRARLRATRDTPTLMQTSPAVSQIAESQQPVVLLWVELAKVDRAVVAMLAARHALVTSQRGRRVLAAFLGSTHADPAGIALGLASELVAAGARVTMHLDAVHVDPGPALRGAAVDRPESWLPAGDWTGLVLTRAVAAVMQAPTRVVEALGPAFRVLARGAERIELVGREALLAERERGSSRRSVGLRGCDAVDPRCPPLDREWEVSRDGRRVGATRWAVHSPRLDRTIALALVERSLGEVGTRLDLHRSDLVEAVEVVPVPFLAPGPGARS